MPAVPGPPDDPKAEGYVVSCLVHDELGNPTEQGQNFWIQSYGAALRHARAIRAAVLAETATPPPTAQLTLDDVITKGG